MHEGGHSSTHTHMRFRGNTSTRKTLNIIKCFKQYILELNISGTTWEKEEAGNGRANTANGSGACWILAGGTTVPAEQSVVSQRFRLRPRKGAAARPHSTGRCLRERQNWTLYL